MIKVFSFFLLGEGLTEHVHVQYECHHFSMFLVGVISLVGTISFYGCPKSPVLIFDFI